MSTTIFEPQNKLIIAEFSAKPLTLDYFLRWGSLGLYRFLEKTYATDDMWLFFAFQVLITLFTLGYALWRDFRYRAYIEQKKFATDDFNARLNYLLKGFSLEKPYELISSSLSVMMRVFYSLTYGYMVVSTVYSVEEIDFTVDSSTTQGFGILFAGVLFVYGIFVMLISVLSVVKVPEQKPIQPTDKQLLDKEIATTTDAISLKKDSLAPEDYEEVDLNDIALVELEGDEKNLTNRVDAYVLESVMFGALTFSGFLTLIAIDPEAFDIGQIRLFGQGLINFLSDFVLFEFKSTNSYGIFVTAPKTGGHILSVDSTTINSVNDIASNLSDDLKSIVQEAVVGTTQVIEARHLSTHFTHAQNLIIWLMLETLISSSFFLLVIASRLRFTQLIEKIDNAINLAKTYNAKEEEVYMLHLQFEKNRAYRNRLILLSAKIEKQVAVAQELIREVKPVVAYMSLFRNLGVLMFLVIISTSLIFFDFRIALFFGFMCLMVYLYKQFDDWYRQRRLRSIIEKHKEQEQEQAKNV